MLCFPIGHWSRSHNIRYRITVTLSSKTIFHSSDFLSTFYLQGPSGPRGDRGHRGLLGLPGRDGTYGKLPSCLPREYLSSNGKKLVCLPFGMFHIFTRFNDLITYKSKSKFSSWMTLELRDPCSPNIFEKFVI